MRHQPPDNTQNGRARIPKVEGQQIFSYVKTGVKNTGDDLSPQMSDQSKA